MFPEYAKEAAIGVMLFLIPVILGMHLWFQSKKKVPPGVYQIRPSKPKDFRRRN